MKEKIKIGYIGLGERGLSMLGKNIFCDMNDVEVTTICDLSQEKLEKAKTTMLEKNMPEPKLTKDYRDIINDPDIDAVIFMTGWSGRTPMVIEAMRAGKYVGVEVGCADNIQECYDLVNAYEETGMPVMMLENCCYGRREMAVLNMVKQGLFGEIVHCTGGYQHYLCKDSLFVNTSKDGPKHYRLPHYVNKNCENYPTHALGPISKVLSINRGNRMVSLASHASKSVGLKSYIAEHPEVDEEYKNVEFKQGDIINTVITCAGGETILLTLDTTLPRAYYSRNFSVRGTKGMSNEDGRVIYLDGMVGTVNDTDLAGLNGNIKDNEEDIKNNEEEMYEKYDHPLHAEYVRKGVKDGHGGMDWLVCRAFVESVKRGTNTPIDVYDTASWMAIGPLSERSVAGGGIPVSIPDFTNGKWRDREPVVEGKYCLDKVCIDEDTPVV